MLCLHYFLIKRKKLFGRINIIYAKFTDNNIISKMSVDFTWSKISNNKYNIFMKCD